MKKVLVCGLNLLLVNCLYASEYLPEGKKQAMNRIQRTQSSDIIDSESDFFPDSSSDSSCQQEDSYYSFLSNDESENDEEKALSVPLPSSSGDVSGSNVSSISFLLKSSRKQRSEKSKRKGGPEKKISAKKNRFATFVQNRKREELRDQPDTIVAPAKEQFLDVDEHLAVFAPIMPYDPPFMHTIRITKPKLHIAEISRLLGAQFEQEQFYHTKLKELSDYFSRTILPNAVPNQSDNDFSELGEEEEEEVTKTPKIITEIEEGLSNATTISERLKNKESQNSEKDKLMLFAILNELPQLFGYLSSNSPLSQNTNTELSHILPDIQKVWIENKKRELLYNARETLTDFLITESYIQALQDFLTIVDTPMRYASGLHEQLQSEIQKCRKEINNNSSMFLMKIGELNHYCNENAEYIPTDGDVRLLNDFFRKTNEICRLAHQKTFKPAAKILHELMHYGKSSTQPTPIDDVRETEIFRNSVISLPPALSTANMPLLHQTFGYQGINNPMELVRNNAFRQLKEATIRVNRAEIMLKRTSYLTHGFSEIAGIVSHFSLIKDWMDVSSENIKKFLADIINSTNNLFENLIGYRRNSVTDLLLCRATNLMTKTTKKAQSFAKRSLKISHGKWIYRALSWEISNIKEQLIAVKKIAQQVLIDSKKIAEKLINLSQIKVSNDLYSNPSTFLLNPGLLYDLRESIFSKLDAITTAKMSQTRYNHRNTSFLEAVDNVKSGVKRIIHQIAQNDQLLLSDNMNTHLINELRTREAKKRKLLASLCNVNIVIDNIFEKEVNPRIQTEINDYYYSPLRVLVPSSVFSPQGIDYTEIDAMPQKSENASLDSHTTEKQAIPASRSDLNPSQSSTHEYDNSTDEDSDSDDGVMSFLSKTNPAFLHRENMRNRKSYAIIQITDAHRLTEHNISKLAEEKRALNVQTLAMQMAYLSSPTTPIYQHSLQDATAKALAPSYSVFNEIIGSKKISSTTKIESSTFNSDSIQFYGQLPVKTTMFTFTGLEQTKKISSETHETKLTTIAKVLQNEIIQNNLNPMVPHLASDELIDYRKLGISPLDDSDPLEHLRAIAETIAVEETYAEQEKSSDEDEVFLGTLEYEYEIRRKAKISEMLKNYGNSESDNDSSDSATE